jgi:hypothetical protein
MADLSCRRRVVAIRLAHVIRKECSRLRTGVEFGSQTDFASESAILGAEI